jgi:hypothetical protein
LESHAQPRESRIAEGRFGQDPPDLETGYRTAANT